MVPAKRVNHLRLTAVLAAGVLSAVVQGCAASDDTSSPAPAGSATSRPSDGVVPWKRITSGPVFSAPPLGDAPVHLELVTSGPADPGRPYEFIVRIRNDGSQPLSLDPCPSYRVQYLPHVEGGYLNCDEAPDAIAPGTSVDFQMQIDVLDPEVPNFGGRYELLWQLGREGTEGETVRKRVPIRSRT